MPQLSCGQQPVTSGLGVAFSSLIKCWDKHKTTAYVVPLGQDANHRCLAEKLHALQSGHHQQPGKGSKGGKQGVEIQQEVANHLDDLPGPNLVPDEPTLTSNSPKPRHLLPDKSTHSLFAKWTQAIPALIPPFLSYIAASTATITQPPSSLQSVCLGACVTRNSTILCLFQDCECTQSSLRFSYTQKCFFPIRLSEIRREILHLPRYITNPHCKWIIPHCTNTTMYGSIYPPGFLSRAIWTILWCHQCDGQCVKHFLHMPRIYPSQQ